VCPHTAFLQSFNRLVSPKKRRPAESVERHNPLHLSAIESALRSLCSFVAIKPLCLSLPLPAPASANHPTYCAPALYSPARENSWNSCRPMLAANAFLKINAKKVTDTLAANNPVFPNPATILPDAGLPPSSPPGERPQPSDIYSSLGSRALLSKVPSGTPGTVCHRVPTRTFCPRVHRCRKPTKNPEISLLSIGVLE